VTSWVEPTPPRTCRLRISQEKVSLIHKEGSEVTHRPGRLDTAAEMLLFDLTRLRHGPQQNAILLETGEALARAYLGGAAGEALRAVVAEAERLGSTVELGLEIDDALAALPWEALRLPPASEGASGLQAGDPLVLHPNVRLFRVVPGLAASPTLPIPGPLRILVVIGSPEEQNARGELLDMERELERILDAVEPARKQERPAYVRILHRGTLAALRAELVRDRFHVLHITCHAGPGALVLEKQDGSADRVDAERLCREALVPDRGVPLVVLAGCATALSVRRKDRGEAALPGLARALLAYGVPAVLAMQAPVGDAYATALGARLYHALAIAEHADPLDAVSAARRLLEIDRRNGDLNSRIGAEWATPALYLRGPSLPLLDPTAPFAEIVLPPEPSLAAGVVVRAVGDFVGRRREGRRLRQAVRRAGCAGLLLHGLGGIGKSSLAAETLRTLFAEGWLVGSLYGTITPDSLLAEAGRTYLAAFQREGMPENDPRRELAVALGRPDVDWEERFDLLSRILLCERKLIVLLDNFEDNQSDDHAVRDEDLAALLARWFSNPGRTRFLITTRYPFELSDRAHRRLDTLHLGPLSFAETRKLLWRLPALDKLRHEDQLRAYADVGGHPRALEYLDALLRGGKARFKDVTRRMEKRLKERGIRQPEAWMKGLKGDLDRVLAEAVTLAVDDVLLDRLLERLEDVPLAKELLVGAAVYRVPVDLLGLMWQVGEEVESDDQGLKLREPEGFEGAWLALKDLGLLAPTGRTGSGTDLSIVHRWTASAVLARVGAEEKVQAHHRAARFWRWRCDWAPQSRADDMEQLLEARHHHYEAGEISEAVKVTEWVVSQFADWGAYRRQEQLCREALAWLPGISEEMAAVFYHQLGITAQKRGDLDEALAWHQKSLQIEEERSSRAGMASTYHELGIIAQARGEVSQALEWYQKSLQINEELGNRAGMAGSYHQMGNLAQARGELSQALGWYQKSLQIEEELGNHVGMANSYHQLGMLAQDHGDLSQAEIWYHKSLQIEEELGNYDGMSTSYHQLGMIAQFRGDVSQAMEWCQKSLQINEELGDRAGMAGSYHSLGMIAQARGDIAHAIEYYHKSLKLFEELENSVGMARSCHQLGVIANDCGDVENALEWYRKSLEINEELGNRVGMASCYHNLGPIAQARGDLSQAQEWCQKSLQIFEELGDRVHMASSYGQLGVLATERGQPAEAVPLTLRSLALRLELDIPQVGTDLLWLRRQRKLLGEERFGEILREHLDADAVTVVLGMMEEDAGAAAASGEL
jgi:tetratricopeptide (TPR) repeat protein